MYLSWELFKYTISPGKYKASIKLCWVNKWMHASIHVLVSIHSYIHLFLSLTLLKTSAFLPPLLSTSTQPWPPFPSGHHQTVVGVNKLRITVFWLTPSLSFFQSPSPHFWQLLVCSMGPCLCFYFVCRFVLFIRFHKSEIIWYLPFSDWLISLRGKAPDSSMLLQMVKVLSFLWLHSTSLCERTRAFFIHSPANVHLSGITVIQSPASLVGELQVLLFACLFVFLSFIFYFWFNLYCVFFFFITI